MPDRITRSMLEQKVEYLSRALGVKLAIDHYSPGGNPYTYQLVEVRENNAQHWLTNYRMTAAEFKAYLNGMIDCMEQYTTVGV